MSINKISFVWLIMGHGKVFRRHDKYDEDNRKTGHYLSMTDAKSNAVASAANGFDAMGILFQDLGQKKPAPKIRQIEDLCERYENRVHSGLCTHWTIYRDFQPWEKYFSGYKDEVEKDFWSTIKFDINGSFFQSINPSFMKRLKAKINEFTGIWKTNKVNTSSDIFNVNAAIDPEVEAGTYKGNAYCRLMLINYDINGVISNEYMANKPPVEGNFTYGFKIPNFQMSLSEVWDNCNKYSHLIKRDYNEKHVNHNCRLHTFIYDSTCNGLKTYIPKETDQNVREYYSRHADAERQGLIGGGIQYGGQPHIENPDIENPHIENLIGKLQSEMGEQSNEMIDLDEDEKTRVDKNFVQATEEFFDWNNPIKAGGGNILQNHKKTKRKFYKKTTTRKTR
jgi:hypothetical protein